MDDEIRKAVQRYGAPLALADELFTLVELAVTRRSTRLTAQIESYEPVELEPPEPTEEVPAGALDTAPERYEDLGLLGKGGMGEVRRMLDTELNRVVAMKIVHERLVGRPHSLARFVSEAQATAQLQHPNILPVHDAGILPDGRAWFTMRQARGRSMAEVIGEVHAGTGSWTFRRLVGAFLSVCQAVAYGHERGVIHRDLKPDNVVVGELGEVYLLDWGLAKVIGRRDWAAELGELPTGEARDSLIRAQLVSGDSPVVTDRAASGSHQTFVGTITGTPVYMAPEQARGEVDRIDARSDVYGLGAMLFEVLSGRLPYVGADVIEVVAKVARGARRPLEPGALPIPAELAGVCERAMALEPAWRYPSAADLAEAVQDWLDGARRREQALEIAQRALEGVDRAAALRRSASDARARGQAALPAEPWRPEQDKAPAWALLDEAERLEREAALAELAVDQGLQAALRVEPELVEAHAALAERARERHAAAETARDPAAAAHETVLRVHAAALPGDHPTRRASEAWLAGEGRLTLHTDPPGATVELFRYELRNRRQLPVPFRTVGPTPLDGLVLPRGSYLCRIAHPERAPVAYPVEIPRLGHWDGRPPGAAAPAPLRLPEAVPEGAVWIPGGWFHSGGDPEAVSCLPERRLWLDDVVVHRTQVTNRQYLAFLDDLVARGRTDEALAHAPREHAGAEETGALMYGFDGARFSLQPDADGDTWDPEWPVVMVDWHGAGAYLRWLAERTGLPWRLPSELELEKAARGADGRAFPWGPSLDPSWCCMIDSHRGPRLPAAAGSHPVDEGPTGVRDLAGNVSDWCLERFEPGPMVEGERVLPPSAPTELGHALIAVRGGSWMTTARYARGANRLRYEPWTRNGGLGFRGAYRP